ncbi:PfkB family carbohydrate kinase [Candidatus Latescibacterota bacterium]
MSIVVVGTVAFDDIVTDHGTVKDTPGGSALYFSAAASLFVPVNVVGVLGDDFPEDVLEFLQRRGVNTDCLKIVKGGKTFRWGGEYECDMNIRKTTNLELNVFMDFTPVLNEACRKSKYVFLGNITPELQLDVLKQVESPEFVGADTIECYIRDDRDKLLKLLKNIDMLMVNDEEARILTGEHNIIAASKALLRFGPEYIIVKKGEHGSILVSQDDMFIVLAYPIEKVIDPTGAGDSYAGGLMGYIAKSDSIDIGTIKSAVVYGNIVASYTVEDFSINRLKTVNMAEIDNRLERFRYIIKF